MVIFQILLLSDKRVIAKERNTVRASFLRASLTWSDNTSKVGYGCTLGFIQISNDSYDVGIDFVFPYICP